MTRPDLNRLANTITPPFNIVTAISLTVTRQLLPIQAVGLFVIKAKAGEDLSNHADIGE
jgi:hypothetical protein